MVDKNRDITLTLSAKDRNAKKELTELVKVLGAVEEGVKDLTGDTAALDNAMKRLQSSAGVKLFADTEKAVGRLNTEYRQTQQEIKRIAAQRKQLDITGPRKTAKEQKEANREVAALSTKLEAAQVRVQKLNRQYKEQLALLREIRRETGAATPAALQSRVAQAQTTIGGVPRTPARVAPAPAPTQRGAAAGAPPFSTYDPTGPRQTLDFYQRLRGQILALTAQYVGLYGAVNQFNIALQEQQRTIATEARVGVALDTTDVEQIAGSMGMLRREAERLGQSFLPFAESYSKFAVSARLSGASLEEVDTVFLNISEALTTVGADTESTRRAFVALEQMFSKGKIASEELKGQLAEALPGAVAVMAESLGVGTDELQKMLEQGEVTSDALLKFSEVITKKTAPQLEAMAQSLPAELRRMGNAVQELRGELVKGAEEGLIAALKELREVISSPEFREFTRNIGRMIGELAEFLANNSDALGNLAMIVGAQMGTRFLQGGLNLAQSAIGGGTGAGGATLFAGHMAAAGEAAKAAGKSLTFLGAASIALERAFVVLTVAFTTFKFAQDVAKNGEGVVGQGARLFGGGVAALAAGLSGASLEEMVRIIEEAKITENERLKIAREMAEARREEQAENARIERQQDAIKAKEQQILDARKAAPGLFEERASEIVAPFQKPTTDIGRIDADEAKAIKELEDEFTARQRDILARREGSTELQTGDQLDEALQLSRDFNDKKQIIEQEAARRRQEIYDREAEEEQRRREDAVREEQSRVDRIQAIHAQLATAADDEVAERENIIASYEKQRAELEKLGGLTAEAERWLQVSKDTALAKHAEAEAQEDLNAKQKALNDLLEERRAKVELIQAQLDAGQLTGAEAQGQMAQVYDNLSDKITAAYEALLKFAKEMKDPTLLAQVEALGVNLNEVKNNADEAGKVWEERFAEGASGALADALTGVKDLDDAMREFFAGFLRDIAQAIIKKQILNAIDSGSGLGGIFGFLGGLTAHTGAVVGRPGGSGGRSLPASVFAAAPRYHNGGIAGLQPNEVPAVLQRGEEVLSRSDPRNILNSGQGAQQAQPLQDIKVINAIDSNSVVSEGLTSVENQRNIINIIQANRNAIKQVLA